MADDEGQGLVVLWCRSGRHRSVAASCFATWLRKWHLGTHVRIYHLNEHGWPKLPSIATRNEDVHSHALFLVLLSNN
eukprot:6471216-Amphidinium_carterae.1